MPKEGYEHNNPLLGQLGEDPVRRQAVATTCGALLHHALSRNSRIPWRDGPEAPSVIRPDTSRITAFGSFTDVEFHTHIQTSVISLLAAKSTCRYEDLLTLCSPRWDSLGGSGKVSFSFQMQHQIPLKGDVQLVIIQNLNAARNCRFRYHGNSCFRRQ
jgi:hypothetical protein